MLTTTFFHVFWRAVPLVVLCHKSIVGGATWLPLEANPEAINNYAQQVGVPTTWQFIDVFDLTPNALALIQSPVVAVLLAFPLTEQAVIIGQEDPGALDEMYFIKQTVGKASATVGLIHAVLNNVDEIQLDVDEDLQILLSLTGSMSPVERGEYLKNNTQFGANYEETGEAGQVSAAPMDGHVNMHFVTFVHHDGRLYELDGRKDAPVHHGPTTADTLMEDAAAVVKKFMARDPEELNFSVMALVQAQQ